jgi:hypothetical protein
MKNLFCILLLIISGSVQAQILPLDEQGKVTFYEVVKEDSLKADLLYTNAKSWLQSLGYTLTEMDSVGGRLVANNAFPVYDKGYVTKKMHGKVGYQLSIEIKDGKYRYWFTDFVFAYYKEDRTYRLVPTGKTKALEETTASGWQHLWGNHRKNTLLMVENLIGQMKTMIRTQPKTSVMMAKQNKKVDW